MLHVAGLLLIALAVGGSALMTAASM